MSKLLRQVVTTLSAWATLLGFALAFRTPEKSLSIGWVLLLVSVRLHDCKSLF